MSIELKMLLYTIVLFLVQLILQLLAEWRQTGTNYTVGPRDDYQVPSGITGRIDRAYFNLLETLTPFAALVFIAHYTGKLNEWTALGAQIYFWGRVAYVPAYMFGIPYLRTLVWIASLAGMVMILWQLLM